MAIVIAGIAIAMSSTNYDLPWTTSGGGTSGGGERTSTNYNLTDVIGQIAPGTSGSTNYQLSAGFLSIMPIGTTVNVYVTLADTGRPVPSGWEVPMEICFFPAGSGTPTIMNGSPSAIYYFSGTSTYQSSPSEVAQYVCTGVADDTYSVTVDSEHTLLNWKKNVAVSSSTTSVDMGTLLEGDTDDSGSVNFTDYFNLGISYGKDQGEAGYDARADFNGDDSVNFTDYFLLGSNYGDDSPNVVP